MPHLSLSFFGGFEARIDTQPITIFGSDKVRALLAFLAIESSRTHRRAELSGIFWPDFPEKKAAHNLSQSLLRLRQALGTNKNADYLISNHKDIKFNLDSNSSIDVIKFLELLTLSDQHRHSQHDYCSLCVNWLTQAVELYRGDLLAGFFLAESVAFEEWRLILQEKLRSQVLDALQKLSINYKQNGNYEKVIVYARQQIAIEPWREEAHIQLMQAYVKCGQKVNALRQYEIFQTILKEELGIQPSHTATSLYKRIQSNQEFQDNSDNKDWHGTSWLSNLGERRHATILVCNHKNDKDEDDTQDHLAFCKQHCEKIFHRFGGIRTPRQGGTCIVTFGFPKAYEDAARRAVHSSLAVTKILKDANPVQIGIHSGMLIVGEKRGDRWYDRDLVGNSLEIARECHRFAKPGEIIITSDTHNLLQGEFEIENLETDAKTNYDEIKAYKILAEKNTQKNIHWLVGTQRLTIFSGREEELNKAIYCYDQIFEKKGQIIFINGEPGIGKSRLILELKRVIPKDSGKVIRNLTQNPSIPWLISKCSARYQNSSLYPIISLFEQLLNFQEYDNHQSREIKLIKQLSDYKFNRPSDIWLLSLLLGLPTEKEVPETITDNQHEQLRKLFFTLIKKKAKVQPFVIVVEDIHWCDQTSLEWIHLLLKEITSTPCLIILSSRPNSKTDWLINNNLHPKLINLNLQPLPAEKSAQIIENLSGPDLLDNETRQLIIARTDGIPLFIEELTKTILEHPVIKRTATANIKLPVSLMDSLSARLDQLGKSKETAQWASVLGREFSYELLKICVPYQEEQLKMDLKLLVEAELVSPIFDGSQYQNFFQSQVDSDMPSRYAFKHAMMQEAAYSSLLKKTKQIYHQTIADTIKDNFPAYLQAHPEVIAEHYNHAGDLPKAIVFWLNAGDLAISRGSLIEAQTFFTRVIENLKPSDSEWHWQALSGLETVSCFQGNRDAQNEYISEMQLIAKAMSDDEKYAGAKIRLARHAASLANYQLQLSSAEEAISAAKRIKNTPLEVEGLTYKLTALMRSDNRSIIQDTVHLLVKKIQETKEDPICSYAMAAIALYSVETGDLTKAVQYLTQSLASVQKLNKRKFDLESQYYGHLGFTYTQLGLYDLARDALESGLKLANMMGMTRYQAYHKSNLGFVYWRLNDLDTAILYEQQALKEYTSQGEIFGQAASLVYMGYIYEEAGQISKAIEFVKKARELFQNLGVLPDMIEAQAVEARLFLKQGKQKQAEDYLLSVWQHLMKYGVEGLSSPCWVINCITETIEQINDIDISYQDTLQLGYSSLIQNAEKISNPEWRESYLENVIENKLVLKKWNDLH